MNKVLFVSPTVYSNPVTKDIQKKFQSLSKVCNPIVYAFSEEKFRSSVEGVEAMFNKKNKNRFLNYLKIIFLFLFILNFGSDKISKANIKREFPAKTAVDSPNFLCVVNLPLLISSSSIQGKSSCISE